MNRQKPFPLTMAVKSRGAMDSMREFGVAR